MRNKFIKARFAYFIFYLMYIFTKIFNEYVFVNFFKEK